MGLDRLCAIGQNDAVALCCQALGQVQKNFSGIAGDADVDQTGVPLRIAQF
ncbi:hypothetical protein M8T12_12760 [Enterobacter ludwigii]|uniref:hypothetical protein n=1 Tax=Enterobacteriaceae TaxID=543 RepID=UPI001C8C1A40|nr:MULTISPECIES: hypothetical protein [Enterobacteriaceae]EES0032871.1 hypothetical protein [Escherichia coli]EKS6729899.1 hypothetical protein [Enterobacter mori]MBX8911078.1 hypothetical protein [Enterobacter ludwigii]MCD9354880.1 hypothetical protein [Klebsiella pneumoniae]MCD9415585.1 hypothetical protein [Klebsiella pneumoniae]